MSARAGRYAPTQQGSEPFSFASKSCAIGPCRLIQAVVLQRAVNPFSGHQKTPDILKIPRQNLVLVVLRGHFRDHFHQFWAGLTDKSGAARSWVRSCLRLRGGSARTRSFRTYSMCVSQYVPAKYDDAYQDQQLGNWCHRDHCGFSDDLGKQQKYQQVHQNSA